MTPQVEGFWDPVTHSLTYVVSDPGTGRAALIDPVLGYRPASGRTDYGPVEQAMAAVQESGLTLDWIIETHVHADHLSAAQYVKDRLGGRLVRKPARPVAGSGGCGAADRAGFRFAGSTAPGAGDHGSLHHASRGGHIPGLRARLPPGRAEPCLVL